MARILHFSSAVHDLPLHYRLVRVLVCLAVAISVQRTDADPPAVERFSSAESPVQALVNSYCIDCHNGVDQEAGLDLDMASGPSVAGHPEVWEQVYRKVVAQQMPPVGEPRPPKSLLDAAMTHLATALDSAAEQHPSPGRTDTFRRLTRSEYQNAIRDLLALDINAQALLPADQSSHGFDNVTVGDLPPALLNRYIDAAQRISRLAIGAGVMNPEGHTVRVAADLTQEKHVPGLPLGTRGGTVVHHNFPRDGEYEIHVHLARDRNEHVEGLREPHDVEFLLDRRSVATFTVAPPKNDKQYYFDDSQLKARIAVMAGPHDLGVTFVQNGSSLLETKRQPLNSHFNFHRHPRLTPAVYQVSITGPYRTSGSVAPRDSTPSRRRVFVTYPLHADEEESSAKQIIANLARRAYRRPVSDEDLAGPMAFFHQAHATSGFESGIEMALSAILVSPRFLFRIERDPANVGAGSIYQISDLELASRLSFFLWSSIPDDQLLDIAQRGELRRTDVFESQVQRMLDDSRSESLVTNFASQWLFLRNLDSRTPDGRIFPDFDDNLRQAMRRETELFFESIIRENRSVLDLLSADYTFLNERLAKHYGIPHIYGSRFRRVGLASDDHRGGLLRHGSILTVTSYATRTSPVIRGNWILENILGTPTPPPPPNVPSLDEGAILVNMTMRKRLAKHRQDPACASCHDLMDPVGFALENYDAIGRWRDHDAGQPIDVSGGLPDGSKFRGVGGLEASLLRHPEMFVSGLTEKLLTYGLGRGVDYRDGPAVRRIVREAGEDDYRFSSLIWGIVNSTPFQMRTSR